MSKNDFQHVRSGEPLVIPAGAYNAMLDAAQAHRNRRMTLAPHGNGYDSLFIHVVNETGKTLQRTDIDTGRLVNGGDSTATNVFGFRCRPKIFHRFIKNFFDAIVFSTNSCYNSLVPFRKYSKFPNTTQYQFQYITFYLRTVA
jgi:hypothetical protein